MSMMTMMKVKVTEEKVKVKMKEPCDYHRGGVQRPEKYRGEYITSCQGNTINAMTKVHLCHLKLTGPCIECFMCVWSLQHFLMTVNWILNQVDGLYGAQKDGVWYRVRVER